jgi:hypothetical protein
MARKKNIVLTIAVTALACFSALGTACTKGKGEGEGPLFLKGIDKEITFGDSIILNEYIKYVTDSSYTIVITGADGYRADVTNQSYWEAQEPGVYTVTYTVDGGENKGTNSFELVVKAPDLTWQYNLTSTIYDVGQTLNFSDY